MMTDPSFVATLLGLIALGIALGIAWGRARPSHPGAPWLRRGPFKSTGARRSAHERRTKPCGDTTSEPQTKASVNR
jgi:hypothetical protein